MKTVLVIVLALMTTQVALAQTNYDEEQDERIAFNRIVVRNLDREAAQDQYEFREFQNHVGRRHDDLNAGVSMALAQGQHVFDPDYDRLQLSIAGATYQSEGAGSLAIGGRITTGSFLSLSVGQDSQGNSGVAGSLSFRF